MDGNLAYSAPLARRPSLGAALKTPQYQSADARTSYPTSPPATDDGDEQDSAAAVDRARLKEVNCDRRRPEDQSDGTRLANMNVPSNLVGQAVTPYLKEHVPNLYSPVSKIEASHTRTSFTKNFNSKYCYRHRPDSKCRKSADEDKMAMIQSVGTFLSCSICRYLCVGADNRILAGTGETLLSRSTSHHPRLEPLLCSTRQA